MQIQIQPMGPYQTNCYIVTIENKSLIIDPGVDATQWVIAHAKNPVAILNTHGHFDHVWSNASLQNTLNIPLYTPKDDLFMLTEDPFGQGTPPSCADYGVEEGSYTIEGIEVTFRHFAGHTPGCSVIEIGDVWFSGDFLFEKSIGRWDFPASNGYDMIESLKRVATIKENFTLYPGHGGSTTLHEEQQHLPYWIAQVQATL
jgi:glyoxylase-like metal-dependent hydrolase (beta-lactamase superfamily II)